MLPDIVADLIPAALALFLGALALLSLPWRRQRSFTIRTEIAAPRAEVWEVFKTNPDDPRSAALHPNTVSVETDPDRPDIVVVGIDASGGHGTHLVTIREEVLEERPPERRVGRIVSIDNKSWPFGEAQRITDVLSEVPGGTLHHHRYEGETATLWQYLAIWRAHRRYFRQLKKLAEAREAPAPANPRRLPVKALAISAIAFASFALWLGWVAALLILAILVVHEFGHWIAFRVTGHPAPRMMLIPFLGGVAVGNHPHKSRFDDAFCALMGPAFSILPVAAMLLAMALMAPPWLAGMPGWFEVAQYLEGPNRYLMFIGPLLLAFGALNLLQLVPILPLDGGQVLRAVIHSFSPVWARRVLLGVAVPAVLGAVWIGDYIIAAAAALGATGAWHMETGPSDARPMSGLSATVIGVAYTATVAVHAGAVIVGLWSLDIL